MLDEVFAYLTFQRKDLLDDCVSLSFNEMKDKMQMASFTFESRDFMKVRRSERDSTPRIFTLASRWASRMAKSSATSTEEDEDLPT